ncbi:SH3R3 ligase, partial [Atractosteus spatula]|nr:SH3R3 ligase [Atractosteus spatula]
MVVTQKNHMSRPRPWPEAMQAAWFRALQSREDFVLICGSGENVPQLPCGKALYNYEGKEPGDLKFNKGDVIILHRKVDENWYHGELNGSHGFLPASYIQCIKPLSQPPPQGKALYDFEVKDKDQDKDCLTFTKDEILTVIRRVDDNWAEGMLGDKIGIFPILYVEEVKLNENVLSFCRAKKALNMWNSSSVICIPCGEQGSPLFRNSENVVIKGPLSEEVSQQIICQTIFLLVVLRTLKFTLNIEHPPPPPFGSLERLYFCSAEAQRVPETLSFSEGTKTRSMDFDVLLNPRSVQPQPIWSQTVPTQCGSLGNREMSHAYPITLLLFLDWQYQFCPHSPPPLSPQAQMGISWDFSLHSRCVFSRVLPQDSSSFAGTSAVTSVPPRVTGVSGDQGTASKVQLPLNIIKTPLKITQRVNFVLNGNEKRISFQCTPNLQYLLPRSGSVIGTPVAVYSWPSSVPAQSTGPNSGGQALTSLGFCWQIHSTSLRKGLYVAMYAYKPQKTDELELRKGELYRVTEKCQDGWFKGLSLRNATSGVFPGNYVTPVFRAPFAGGQPRTALPGSAQAIKVVPSSPQSAGPSSPVLLGSAARPGPAPAAPPTSPQLQPASLHLKNCLRISGQQTVSQARSALQLVHSPPAPGPERPTATVPPLRNQSSSSSSCRSQAAVTRPLSVASPQHAPPPATPLAGPGSPGARSTIPLTSAAAAITPPNVSATILNGEAAVGPLRSPSPAQPPGASASLPKPEEKKVEKKEKKAGGLLKLLSGASAKKKSRSPPSVSPTHEPQTPAAAAAEGPVQGATAANLPSGLSHGRAGSCPIESEMQGAMGMEPLHRKSGSLDLNFSVSPPARQPCSSLVAIRPEPKPLSRERYRVVVPYPPQSEAEIELKEGDIVFVHKKRDDGWFKGTLQRTGRTGLFPGSFVESF